jgi:WD40 repeat protein
MLLGMAKSAACARPVPPVTGPAMMTGATFSPSGRYALVRYFQSPGAVFTALVEVPTGKEIGHVDYSRGPAPVFHPDSKHFLAPNSDQDALVLRSTLRGTRIRSFGPSRSQVCGFALAADGRHALTGHFNGRIALWDVSTGKDVRVLAPGDDGRASSATAVRSLFFLADGRHAVSAAHDALHEWDVFTGKQTHRFPGYGKVGPSHTLFRVSADGRFACSGCTLFDRTQPTVRVWDLKTGKLAGAFSGHKDYLRDAAFDGDGQHVFSAGRESLCRWHLRTEKQVWRVDLGERVTGVAFSADGRQALVGEVEGGLQLWDLSEGKVLWKKGPSRE